MGPTNEHSSARARTLPAALVAPVMLLPLLDGGGIVPILIAAGVSLAIGVPAAQMQWRSASRPASPPALAEALGSGIEVSSLLWLGVLLSHAFALGLWSPGAAPWVMSLVCARALAPDRYPAAFAALGLASLAVLCVSALVGLEAASPWTLLEPRWEPWQTYAGPSALVGLLSAGVGTGLWSSFVRRPPGERHAPWAVAGASILAALALVVERAVRFEQGLGEELPPPVHVQIATALLFASSVGPTLARERTRPWARLGRAAVVAGIALLLAGPAAGARPAVASVIVPLLALFPLLSSSVRAERGERILLVSISGALLVSVGVSWPGLPLSSLDALILGAIVVGSFWVVATRSVLAGRAT